MRLTFLRKFLKDIFTGVNNKTYDGGKVAFWLIILFYCVLEAVDVHHTGTFECRDWAEGISFILTAGGVHLFLKKDTEPNQ